jgi:hypothetical protein
METLLAIGETGIVVDPLVALVAGLGIKRLQHTRLECLHKLA